MFLPQTGYHCCLQSGTPSERFPLSSYCYCTWFAIFSCSSNILTAYTRNEIMATALIIVSYNPAPAATWVCLGLLLLPGLGGNLTVWPLLHLARGDGSLLSRRSCLILFYAKIRGGMFMFQLFHWSCTDLFAALGLGVRLFFMSVVDLNIFYNMVCKVKYKCYDY